MGTHKIAESTLGRNKWFFRAKRRDSGRFVWRVIQWCPTKKGRAEDQKNTENNLVSDFFPVRRPILVIKKKRFRKVDNEKRGNLFLITNFTKPFWFEITYEVRASRSRSGTCKCLFSCSKREGAYADLPCATRHDE